MAAVSARARVHSVVVTMRAASARESTSVTTKADSILPRSKRREGVLSAGGSKRNDGAHHITASLLEPVPWTLSTTGRSWVSFGGPARSLLLGRCVLLLGRSVLRNAVQPRTALHIIINSGSWAHLALRLTRLTEVVRRWSRPRAVLAPCCLVGLVITLIEEVRGEGCKKRTIHMSAPFFQRRVACRNGVFCFLLCAWLLVCARGSKQRGVARFRSRGLP